MRCSCRKYIRLHASFFQSPCLMTHFSSLYWVPCCSVYIKPWFLKLRCAYCYWQASNCLLVGSLNSKSIYKSDTYSRNKYNVSHIYLLIHNSAANIMYPSQLSESLSNLSFFKMKYKTKQKNICRVLILLNFMQCYVSDKGWELLNYSKPSWRKSWL